MGFDGARFLGVFNLRFFAIAFYLLFALVAPAAIEWTWGRGIEEWLVFTAFAMRHLMVSAACVVFAIALTEALTSESTPRRVRLAWAVGLIVAGAPVAALIRLTLGGNGGVMRLSTANWLDWFVPTVLLWTLLGGLCYWLYSVLRDEERTRHSLVEATSEQERLAAQAAEAELSALQAQIEPHFLFNTLATVKRLYETDVHRGRAMMDGLIAYFRAVLPSLRSASNTLGTELELVSSYLTILKLRMGERLVYSINCEPELARFPLAPMLLTTLVENAIKHGLSPLPEGGRIDIRVSRQGAGLCLQVADTGRGFVADSGSGVGLSNTRQRLQALYGRDASLRLRANEPRGVVAEIYLPLAGAAP